MSQEDRPAASNGTGSRPLVIAIEGRIARADIDVLCGRLARLLMRGSAPAVVCRVSSLRDPDAATVDALARLHLVAARMGRRMRFEGVTADLEDLAALMGVRGYLDLASELGVEPLGEPEQREQVRRVEEEDDPRDAPL